MKIEKRQQIQQTDKIYDTHKTNSEYHTNLSTNIKTDENKILLNQVDEYEKAKLDTIIESDILNTNIASTKR